MCVCRDYQRREPSTSAPTVAAQAAQVFACLSAIYCSILKVSIDGLQMSIKRPTSGGQARDQEAAVQ